MKTKKCPRCGAPLIEETYENENRGSSTSLTHMQLQGSASSYGEGSIDVYLAPNTRFSMTVYRCPNPKCGYLSTDC